jgi:hypothetical protein
MLDLISQKSTYGWPFSCRRRSLLNCSLGYYRVEVTVLREVVLNQSRCRLAFDEYIENGADIEVKARTAHYV